MRMLAKKTDEFAVFILSNRRPDNVLTYHTLIRSGYTGRVVILIDSLDDTKDRYLENFGDKVEVFDKVAAAKTTDAGDNFNTLRSVLFARNASFEVAKRLGIKYFVQLDDDYRHFQFRFDHRLSYRPKVTKNLDEVFAAFLRFYKAAPIISVALSQGGDFIGGQDSKNGSTLRLMRKCMNSFFCSTDRPFKFVAMMNDDVTTYVTLGKVGNIFFTSNQVSLEQTQTQANPGGLTELYLEMGTYVKSFYSVMFQPSSVKIRVLSDRNNHRLHHSVAWKNTVPMILPESTRKS